MIEINNLTNFAIDENVFSTVAKKVLSGENRKTKTISLAFVGEAEIKKINKEYRAKNKPTDVLSFRFENLSKHAEKDFLGEIVICPEVVKENAKKYGSTFDDELMKVFVHGILHLCGYDHEKSEKEAEKMEKIQNKYLLR